MIEPIAIVNVDGVDMVSLDGVLRALDCASAIPYGELCGWYPADVIRAATGRKPHDPPAVRR